MWTYYILKTCLELVCSMALWHFSLIFPLAPIFLPIHWFIYLFYKFLLSSILITVIFLFPSLQPFPLLFSPLPTFLSKSLPYFSLSLFHLSSLCPCLSLLPSLVVPCFLLSGLTQICWVLMRQCQLCVFVCMCLRGKRETSKVWERTCFCTLHLSPVTTHHHQTPSLWNLSASVLLSVHGGLGMDGWSREGEEDKTIRQL